MIFSDEMEFDEEYYKKQKYNIFTVYKITEDQDPLTYMLIAQGVKPDPHTHIFINSI